MDQELGYACEPEDLTWKEIENITNHFSEDKKIGSGGYGVVYKGVRQNGQEIAVKKLYHKPGLDEKQFQNELRNLTGLKHRNIVRLLGKSYKEEERYVEYNGRVIIAKMVDRVICLEYLHNGSLENHLSDESSGLPWHKRYKIIKGICEGLLYLHERSIFHLDLKPANILLDNNMLPKIADFGLSRLFSGTHKSHTTDNFIGTLGYVPPEYIEKGKISEKFDVFSFGVIIMGIMTGPGGYYKHCDIPPRECVELVTENWTTSLRKAWKDMPYLDAHCQQVKTCMEIAINCVGDDRHRRPSIGDILRILKETEATIDELYKQQFIVQPSNLLFPLELDKLTSCPLHLTNKTDQHIAFRIRQKIPKIFAGSLHGVVPARHTQTFILTMKKEEKALCSNLNNIHIETTVSDLHSSMEINKEIINSLFIKSHAVHDEMKQVIITSSDDTTSPPKSEARIEVLSLECIYTIDVHPVEPWILTCGNDGKAQVWNYLNMEKLMSSYEIQSTHGSTSVGKFIARKQWFVVGYTDGYIDVYCYKTMRQLEHFKAHQAGHIKDLAVHPTDPYVLSASFYEGNVKLWDWEKGWKCTRMFQVADFHMVYQVRLNLMDTNTFAVRGDTGTKICRLRYHGSNGFNFILDEYDDQDIWSFDYCTTGGNQYLIIGGIDGTVEIWDLHTKSLVETVEGVHLNPVEAVYSHPKHPLLVTGSSDGCVCLWNTTTLRPARTFNFDLGGVTDVKLCLDDSRRVLIAHKGGLAMIEMDQNELGAYNVSTTEENDWVNSKKRKLSEQDWLDIKSWKLAI